jgi:hypothetical protein
LALFVVASTLVFWLHWRYKLAAARSYLYMATFFSTYDRRLLRQKTGGACLYMPQVRHCHWLASFEVIPPQRILVFLRPKKENSPLKTGVSVSGHAKWA